MFSPHVTVACIIKYKQKYLVVEEQDNGRTVLNQPAGHLESDESLIAAVTREVWEETGLTITPQGLVGSYLFTSPINNITYLRFCFYYEFDQAPPACKPQDPDIINCHWLTLAELETEQTKLRSALVLEVIEDFVAGQKADLSLVKHYPLATV
ncbi:MULTISPECIES: NUDIX hydrolase [unclassified Motilimonas]|uniref:NUDIX hydrolase n=1 Tax=Motilimonas TaxID=1914248 RepID=UPI001E51E00A|nr:MULTISPECIES: NUDIX hydrolase [unclassified Motilimonas]MCE0556410.1 NUDIX hydrolase [Motilimonas sp. E26]MDO6525820.1 NUDIX hydrolase [Motilimonas sp. 1_MG-2023]